MIGSICCVLRSGGRYSTKWVRSLQAGVLTYWQGGQAMPQFVCLTDVPFSMPGVRTIKLTRNWPGWWSKIEIFRGDLDLPRGATIFFDLDTLIVGSLDFLKWHDFAFAALRDFSNPTIINSSVMIMSDSFRKIAAQRIYPMFHDKMCDSVRGGDQEFIGGRIDQLANEDIIRPHMIQDIYGGRVVSYQKHCNQGLPKAARVVCFHGEPKPDTLPAGSWPHEKWENL